MSNGTPLVYLESSLFIAVVKNEAGRVEMCRAALADAQSGSTSVMTSSLTLAEVVRPPGGVVTPETEVTLQAFFQHSWLRVAWVDRRVAEEARRITRAYGLKPPDAIHVATATLYQAATLFTYDEKILAIENDVPGLSICHPGGQMRLGF